MTNPRLRFRSVVVLAVAAMLAACGGVASSSPPSPTTAATSMPTASPAGSGAIPTPSMASTSAAPTADGWQPVPDQASVTNGQFLDIVWTGARFVAIGTSDDGGIFVDSLDALTWRSRSAGGLEALPRRLASGPRGIVALGRIGEKLASWSSTNGVTLSHRAGAFPGSVAEGRRLEVKDVVASATGWLAVGRVVPDCRFPCGEPPVRAVAWTSPDGLVWTEVPATSALAGGGMSAVAATSGGFVGGGQRGDDAAFWTSADGIAWEPVPEDPVFGPPPGADPEADVEVVSMAAGHGVVVAFGMAFGAGDGGAPIVVAWRSADGRTWTRAEVELAAEGQVFKVAATSGRFLATGASGGDSCRGGIWGSADGASWDCIAGGAAFEGFGPYAAAGSPFAEVAVGLTSVGWDPDSGRGLPGAIWWRPVP